MILWLLISVNGAQAQLPPGLPLPPDNYALPHLWGSPSAINIEHFAMGGACAADSWRDWHSNPAGLLSVTQPQALTYMMSAGFDGLPTFHSNYFGYAQPLGRRTAIKL